MNYIKEKTRKKYQQSGKIYLHRKNHFCFQSIKKYTRDLLNLLFKLRRGKIDFFHNLSFFLGRGMCRLWQMAYFEMAASRRRLPRLSKKMFHICALKILNKNNYPNF